MKIHPLEIGQVKITSNWKVGQGTGLMRLANTMLDSEFTDWLPVYAWVIEHPEGLIVIDTGIPADANSRVYFPLHMPLIQRAAFFRMSAELEIGQQMRGLGLDPKDVRWVVLTHLHQDHDGGLKDFAGAQFLVSEAEWAAAQGFQGRMGGYLNRRWPSWFAPSQVSLTGNGLGAFAGDFTLTKAGDIHLVPTPGHSAGHMSVILNEGKQSILFAGDASYSQDTLLAKQADGVAPDPAAQLDSHRRILNFASRQATVYLPSHDPKSAERLSQRAALPV